MNCNRINAQIAISDFNSTWTYVDFRMLLDSIKNISTPDIPPSYNHFLFQKKVEMGVQKSDFKEIVYDIYLSLVTNCIKICIVNNLLSYEIPVARLFSPEIKILFSAFDKSMTAVSSLNFEVEYFNLKY